MVLQLGAELISSDEIAFYELIKNAIDARSPGVEIDIVIRLSHDEYLSIRDELLERKRNRTPASAKYLAEMKDRINSQLSMSAPHIKDFKNQLENADSMDELLNVLHEANYIDIKDTGEGMSLRDLKEVYLTIGTRSRLMQRSDGAASNGRTRPLLGEKGVGRLSTMRLAQGLFVKTSRRGESRWNELRIDWSRFSHDSDELLEKVQFEPNKGEVKKKESESGTLIHLSALTSKWDSVKIQTMVNEQFSRFSDPFDPNAKYPIGIYYNNDLFVIPDFDQSVFKYAHATAEAEFIVEDADDEDSEAGLRLKGRINYRLREIKKSFNLIGPELKSATKVGSLKILRRLGPFKMKAYWYNRPLIRASAGIPDYQYVKKTVNAWAGGLMLYRDGFRVHPYGGPNDDWLDLDHRALSSGGYKVNRRQIIGKVEISSAENPLLIDQTNREGLRESDEKRAMVMLLKHVLETEMRAFLNNVEKNIYQDKQLDIGVLAKRVDAEVKSALRNVQELVGKLPDSKKEVKVIGGIHESFKKIQQSMTEAKEIADSYRRGHNETVHLAGVGLMVEMLAHELNRTAAHALSTLSETKETELPTAVRSRFRSLESQMKTLQKRLRVLDPLSTAGRQRKETFDLVSWIDNILMDHADQFKRHNIKVATRVLPKDSSVLRVKLVKGMIVQVMENLISNSVYWLKQQSSMDKSFSPRIEVIIDTEAGEIDFTDNGPGVDPARREEIFLPFVTLKPSGAGKGLGLYIAREIATYHDARLQLSEAPSVHKTRLNTFVFSLGKNV